MALTNQDLYLYAQSAQGAIDRLGSAAPWMLVSSLPEFTELHPPRIPNRQGCTTGLFYVEDLKQMPTEILSTEFVLPFQWKKEESSDSSKLPIDFQGKDGIAENVRVAIASSPVFGSLQEKAEDWTLHFPKEISEDFSALKFSANSIEAPLIAGLLIALYGGTPKPNVFATGNWTKEGMRRIEEVERKIDAILALQHKRKGFNEAPILFVPADNWDKAQNHLGKLKADDPEKEIRLQIKQYPVGEADLEKCFREHLQVLDAPPSKEMDLEARTAYANRPYVRANGEKRLEYYLENLLGGIADKLGKKSLEEKLFPHNFQKELSIDKMLLSLSLSFEVAALIINALKPKRVYLLATKKSREKEWEKLEKYIPQGTEVHLKDFIEGKEAEALTGAVQFFQQETEHPEEAGTPLRCSITSGSQEMVALIVAASLRNNVPIFHLKHDTQSRPVYGPTYGTERFTSLSWLQQAKLSQSTKTQ